MIKGTILTEEETSTILKALYLYLSASDKKERQEASIIAKEAYEILKGSEYVNPENQSFKTLMLEIL
jgi:hypothetical protein